MHCTHVEGDGVGVSLDRGGDGRQLGARQHHDGRPQAGTALGERTLPHTNIQGTYVSLASLSPLIPTSGSICPARL